MERQEGYYWVKYKGDWIVASLEYYDNPEWFLFFGQARESDFDEIGDRIPMPDEACEWRCADDDENYWEGSCGIAYNFIDGGPKENDITFCPHCGRRIKVVGK